MSACNDYQVTRRSMLKMFSASMLGMPISQLLAQSTRSGGTAEHVILFWNSGGMSHLDTWDPKPGRPTQGEFNPIKTSVPDMEISEIFPQLAKQMHHAALIRSIRGTNGDHGRAQYELQTGFNVAPNVTHPGLGSLVVHERDPLGDLPAFISISGQAARSGYLGQQCEAYYVGRPGEKDPYLAFPEGIHHERGQKRLEILARMNARTSGQVGAEEIKAAETALKDAVTLMESPALKAFELKNESAETIARYGDTEFGRGALLARRLVEKGVRFVQVNRGGFDNHGNIFEAMRGHGNTMDPALASLISDLKANGLLSKTLVVVLSEFGRTPRVNTNGGRDHWARVFSAFMAGGGIKGGSIVGSSDEDGMDPAERPVRVFDLHASICHALGIDITKELHTHDGRPMKIVRKGGEPIPGDVCVMLSTEALIGRDRSPSGPGGCSRSGSRETSEERFPPEGAPAFGTVTSSATGGVCGPLGDRSLPVVFLISLFLIFTATAQDGPQRGSIIEDRAARKLMQAGDARLELGENEKALEIWESVVERYPRSPVRFEAYLRLADHLLDERREYDKARLHYEAAADESNEDDKQRAYSFLHTGVCYYEAARYGQCFKVMREVIETFPAAAEVNEAYYYIGLGHFKQGHYSRAIEALEKVGTILSEDDAKLEKVEAGKRLFVRIDDKDFAILEPGQRVMVRCRTRSGDEETIACDPVGRGAKIALGSIVTRLDSGTSGNGILEVRGGDRVTVTYVDAHTAEKTFDEKRLKEVDVVGNGVVRITDGTYEHDLPAAVLGKPVHLQVADADHDTSDERDRLTATAEVYRRKTPDEIDEEIASKVASGELTEAPDGETLKDQIEPLKLVRAVPVTLRESEIRGTFRAAVPLVIESGRNGAIQGEAGQFVRLVYEDERHLGSSARIRTAQAGIIEGNLGEMRVTRTEISDEELRLKTKLRTASALTEVGNHYKEFGLDEKADLKYGEALTVCEDILTRAQEVGGELLEETYVQLWRIYFAMDQLDLALSMSKRLLREFPQSAFVDEAMIQQAHVERKRGNFTQAINLYAALAKLPDSDLRGEGQFFVGQCYEEMALKALGKGSDPLFEKAFMAYQKVYENFPESGRVGDAVAKMAAFYYQKQDYSRAVDVFENVLADYPDANFLDVILFNYGRCLYKLGRKDEAGRKFDQLIRDFPESEIAPEAKKIVDALKGGAG